MNDIISYTLQFGFGVLKFQVVCDFWIWPFFSLQGLHKKLLIEETSQRRGRTGHFEDKYWHGDNEMVHAVWTLVHMCGSNDASGVRELVSDFISRVWQSETSTRASRSPRSYLNFTCLLSFWFIHSIILFIYKSCNKMGMRFWGW